jgi:hypothetical protein
MQLILGRYGSVRIDAVHYCELEEILSQKRYKRRKSATVDPPGERLALLARTVWENQQLAHAGRLLKLPYMTRESCKAELARAVSVLRNLLYVDLPDGFFTDDPSCLALRQELQASCSNIRKMKYEHGSEASLQLLAHGHWPNLEILDLDRVAVDPSTLRIVLASLTAIRELRLTELSTVDDSIFHSTPNLPPFPTLQSLTLTRIERITYQGIVDYLSDPHNPFTRDSLTSLSLLHMPNISTTKLHAILAAAPNLQSLSYTSTAPIALPLEPLPPLASSTLRVLYYEITNPHNTASPNQALFRDPTESHHAYLASSLHANALPSLRKLYVRDASFADSLLLAPPVRPFAAGEPSPHRASARLSTNNPYLAASSTGGSTSSSGSTNSSNLGVGFHNGGFGARASFSDVGFQQQLEIYSKGMDELDWVYTTIAPPTAPGRPSSRSGDRPLSSFTAQLGPQWGGDARKSVIVGNGFGGFLAVPTEEYGSTNLGGRPSSSGGLGGSGFGNATLSVPSGGAGHPGNAGHRPRTGSLGRFSLGGTGLSKEEKIKKADLWR